MTVRGTARASDVGAARDRLGKTSLMIAGPAMVEWSPKLEHRDIGQHSGNERVTKKQDLDPEHSLGYQVRRCHRRFDRLLNAYLTPRGLQSGFWYYLRVLWRENGVTQKYLSDMTNVTENTTASMINGMMKHGLVERNPDPKDRRKVQIILTDRGKRLEDELMRYAIDINRIAVAGIDPADVSTCVAVLKRMSANLAQAFDDLPDKADAP